MKIRRQVTANDKTLNIIMTSRCVEVEMNVALRRISEQLHVISASEEYMIE